MKRIPPIIKKYYGITLFYKSIFTIFNKIFNQDQFISKFKYKIGYNKNKNLSIFILFKCYKRDNLKRKISNAENTF